MKMKFKGFTLVECIVALAIIGIAGLTMAQIYANVAQRNLNNHLVNTSLANQMAYVEKYSKSDLDTYALYYATETDGKTPLPDPQAKKTSTDKYPPHKQTGRPSDIYVTVESSYKPSGSSTGSTYSYAADIFILQSRDADNAAVADSAEAKYALRYKYLVGHVNKE